MSYVMGIDAGTTAIKAAIYSTSGNTIAVGSKSVNIEKPKLGWAEEDMWEVWSAAKLAIKNSLKKAKVKPEEIAAIGLSGQGGGAWLVDERGSPVRKAITWLDLRAGNEVNELEKKGLNRKIYDITGWRIFPGTGPVLLKWLQENETETLEKARYFLRCKDWIKFRLTGIPCTDASYMIFEVNLETNKYSTEIFDILGIDKKYIDLFPPMVPAWEIVGTVSSASAKETGLRKGTPVASGGYDVPSNALGAGIINDRQLFAIIGTAGIFAAVVNHPVFDPNKQVSVNPHVVPNLYVLNCQSMTATPNLDWFLSEFCKDLLAKAKAESKNIYDMCNEIVSKVPPGARGVVYHPYLQGEIGPFVKASARAMFTGLSLWHKREHMLRAVYEGVGFSMLDNFQRIKELLSSQTQPSTKEVTVVGGGAQSDAWLQILADINDLNISVPEGMEFGCRGAAINAGIAVDLFKNHREAVEAFVKIRKIFCPKDENSKKYRQLFKVYREIYQSLWDIWENMTALQA